MRTLSLTFHLLLPAAVRSDFNCRGVLSQSPKGKRISDLNATLVKHGENGAQRVVQQDALCASSYKMFVEDDDSYLTDRGGEVGSEGGPLSEIEPLGCCGVHPSTYYRF